MTRPLGPVRLLLAASILSGAGWIGSADGAQDREDIALIVARVGERIAAYYQRAQQIVCTERSTVIPIGSSLSRSAPDGFARTVESELRVEMDASEDGDVPGARVTRDVRRVNGREPRERDKKHRSGCTDPTPVSPEPLAFLLPGQREEYRFTGVRGSQEAGRTALVIDFTSVRRTGRPELVEDEYGHDDCFDWKGPVATAGRVWVDAATYDVLRLERRLTGPTDVTVPLRLQRKYQFSQWLTIDRDDVTMRYREVKFRDPDETVMLPESIESTTVLRTSLQSVRRTQTFSDYRRFLTFTSVR